VFAGESFRSGKASVRTRGKNSLNHTLLKHDVMKKLQTKEECASMKLSTYIILCLYDKKMAKQVFDKALDYVGEIEPLWKK